MHLENVDPMRLKMTIQYLLDMNIQTVIPLHCTGLRVMCEMKQLLGELCLTLCGGMKLKIEKFDRGYMDGYIEMFETS